MLSSQACIIVIKGTLLFDSFLFYFFLDLNVTIDYLFGKLSKEMQLVSWRNNWVYKFFTFYEQSLQVPRGKITLKVTHENNSITQRKAHRDYFVLFCPYRKDITKVPTYAKYVNSINI